MYEHQHTWTVIKQNTVPPRKVDTIKCGICHEEPVFKEGDTCYSCQARQLNVKYEQEQERICSHFVMCPECGRMPARIGSICGRCRGKKARATA